jgi:hypothetical protein
MDATGKACGDQEEISKEEYQDKADGNMKQQK